MLCMIQIKKKKNSLSKRFNLKYSPNIRQIHKVPSRAQESMQRDCIKASWDGSTLTAHSCLFLPWKGERNTTKKKLFPTFYPFFLFVLWKRQKNSHPIPANPTTLHKRKRWRGSSPINLQTAAPRIICLGPTDLQSCACNAWALNCKAKLLGLNSAPPVASFLMLVTFCFEYFMQLWFYKRSSSAWLQEL